MITKKTMAKCSHSIVASMNLARGDSVMIQGGTHTQQLLEDIAYECYRVGALPLIVSSSDTYKARVMKGIPARTLEQVPQHMTGAAEKMDCLIGVERYEDPAMGTKFPRNKIEARVKAGLPMRKILHGEETGVSKKWLYAGWPTKKAAKFFGVNYSLYERFIIEGMTVPISRLRGRCQKVDELLEGAEYVHITDPEGTDLELRIGGRLRNLDDGFVSEEDVEANNKGSNLPAGEVFMAPHETWGSGKIFCPLTIDRFSGKIVTDVELSYEKGKLDLKSARASKNQDALVNSFKQSLRLDMKAQKVIRTLNLSELGIGCNPKITKAIGYVLTDEKIIGSVHVAFGSNSAFGWQSKSLMHWDFVTTPKVTMVARDKDGVERTVMTKGRLKKAAG
jgi:aminopeptidase